jgi:predicted dehydrogenase
MIKLKGAVAGLGKMGLSHAAIVGAHPDVDLISVCDTSSFVLDAFKKFSTIRTYTDYQKMIDDMSLDFIIVATPTKYHYQMVKYALERGLHVFCEKPFSLNTSQGKELVDLAASKMSVNQVGFHNHFIGTFRELKRLLDKNVIGEIVHFTGEAYGPVVTKEKGGTWRSKPEEGGGCLYDYASHVINLVQEIIGRPEKICGSLLKKIYSRDVEDAVYCLLKLKSGLTGTLLVNWSDDTYRKMSTSLTLYGKKGKIICDATEIKIYLKEHVVSEKLDKGWTIKYITDLAIPVNFYLRGEEYSAQIDYFIGCIKDKSQVIYNSFEQAVYTDQVIEMIVKDAKNY